MTAPLSDFAPAIIGLLLGIGGFVAAHLLAWRAHARAGKAAAARNSGRIAPRR